MQPMEKHDLNTTVSHLFISMFSSYMYVQVFLTTACRGFMQGHYMSDILLFDCKVSDFANRINKSKMVIWIIIFLGIEALWSSYDHVIHIDEGFFILKTDFISSTDHIPQMVFYKE